MELEEKDAFSPPMDKAHELFSSAFQLKMIKDVVYSEAYQAEAGEEDDVVDFGRLMDPEDGIEEEVEDLDADHAALVHGDHPRLGKLPRLLLHSTAPQFIAGQHLVDCESL